MRIPHPLQSFFSAFFAVSFIAFTNCGSAFAQQSKVEAGKLEFDDLLSPQMSSGSKDKKFTPKQWLEIEVPIKVDLAPKPKSMTCDSILVKFYVAVQNPDKRGTYYVLSKDVTFINVPLEEEVYCSVYLSPASILRLSGSSRGGKDIVEAVGYEVLVNGEKKAVESSKGRDWWNSGGGGKFSRTDVVPLLTKPETPFASLWWDRYAETKQER